MVRIKHALIIESWAIFQKQYRHQREKMTNGVSINFYKNIQILSFMSYTLGILPRKPGKMITCEVKGFSKNWHRVDSGFKGILSSSFDLIGLLWRSLHSNLLLSNINKLLREYRKKNCIKKKVRFWAFCIHNYIIKICL